MSDIPPKQPVSGTAAARVESGYDLPPIAPAGGPLSGEYTPGAEPGALVSIHAAALHAGSDSFPVLKAFQDYLETERQRARRRLVMHSSFFVALMAVVVAGLLLAGVYLFRNMQRTQDVLLQAALQGAPAAAPLVAPAVVAPPPPAPAMPAALGDELQRLRAALADLRSDNEKLRTRLTAPSAAPTALPAPTAVAAAPAPAVTPASPPPPAAPSVASPRKEPLPTAVAAVRPQPPDGFADGTLHLPAGADEDPLPWRLFVPLR
jgi:hypothetical protein